MNDESLLNILSELGVDKDTIRELYDKGLILDEVNISKFISYENEILDKLVNMNFSSEQINIIKRTLDQLNDMVYQKASIAKDKKKKVDNLFNSKKNSTYSLNFIIIFFLVIIALSSCKSKRTNYHYW